MNFADIEAVCRERGIPPSKLVHSPGFKSEPKPIYTLPAIFDPNSNQYISESAKIMRYLDDQFPANPSHSDHPAQNLNASMTHAGVAFPPHTLPLQTAFLSAFTAKVLVPVWPCIIPSVSALLPEGRHRDAFNRTREDAYGRSVSAWAEDPQEVRSVRFEKVLRGWEGVGRWLDAGLEEGEERRRAMFVMGNEPVFADYVIAATLAYMKNVFGEESGEWEEICRYDRGRWSALSRFWQEYDSAI